MITGLKIGETLECHTDTAYTSAVARLRGMLVATERRGSNMVSVALPAGVEGIRGGAPSPHLREEGPTSTPATRGLINEDVLQLIEKQFLYINQLESETAKNGQELISILEKVEEVVKENETLQEQQKTTGLLHAETGTGNEKLILNSRLAELEAKQLQSARSLRLAQEEVLALRKQLEEQPRPPLTKFPMCDLHLAEIQNISRERNELVQTVGTLQQSLHQFKEREKEATDKVKSSLELVEQMRQERTKHEDETKQLKEEVLHLNQRVRELITETSQKLLQGKLEAEKSCATEMSRLKAEYNQEFECSMKAKLDLDAHKRLERELTNNLCEKDKMLSELRQHMLLKIDTLQTHLSQTMQQKTRTETDLMSMRLQAEKIERQGKQETSRLNAELTLIRQRLAESESDLKKSGDAILDLKQRISDLDRNSALADKVRRDRQVLNNEQVMKVTAEAVQQKYVMERRTLEGVIQKQSELMDKLRNECYHLAQALEEASSLFKKGRAEMAMANTRLAQQNTVGEKKCKDLEQKVQFYAVGQEQMMNRLHSLQAEEKAHAQKVVALAKKQGVTQIEKERLEGELEILKSKAQLLKQTHEATS